MLLELIHFFSYRTKLSNKINIIPSKICEMTCIDGYAVEKKIYIYI